ncbi:MAG: histone [Nanoarchaeota archaeon]
MVESYISLAAMDTLLHEAGGKRVSIAAKEVLRDALEKNCQKIGQLAMTFARHAGRSTIRKEDILLAINQIDNRDS